LQTRTTSEVAVRSRERMPGKSRQKGSPHHHIEHREDKIGKKVKSKERQRP